MHGFSMVSAASAPAAGYPRISKPFK